MEESRAKHRLSSELRSPPTQNQQPPEKIGSPRQDEAEEVEEAPEEVEEKEAADAEEKALMKTGNIEEASKVD